MCVITQDLVRKIFPYQDPLQSTVRVKNTYYQVVGIVDETGTSQQRPQIQGMDGQAVDNNIYIPLSTARSRFGELLVTMGSGSMSAERVNCIASSSKCRILLQSFPGRRRFSI